MPIQAFRPERFRTYGMLMNRNGKNNIPRLSVVGRLFKGHWKSATQDVQSTFGASNFHDAIAVTTIFSR